MDNKQVNFNNAANFFEDSKRHEEGVRFVINKLLKYKNVEIFLPMQTNKFFGCDFVEWNTIANSFSRCVVKNNVQNIDEIIVELSSTEKGNGWIFNHNVDVYYFTNSDKFDFVYFVNAKDLRKFVFQNYKNLIENSIEVKSHDGLYRSMFSVISKQDLKNKYIGLFDL